MIPPLHFCLLSIIFAFVSLGGSVMHKNKNYKMEFSERLREAMLLCNYGSSRSTLGVSPAALRDAVGCHLEMALRYLDGRSIPDPETLVKIAMWLNVDPGTLLFGDASRLASVADKNLLKIDSSLLEYALTKLLKSHKRSESAPDKVAFFMSILSDLGELQVDRKQLIKIFDLAIKSSDTANNINVLGNNEHGKSRSKKSSGKIAS
jgi:transcriptional regulator with XRE-family HTH domain